MKMASQFCFEGFLDGMNNKFSDEYLDEEMWNTINDIAPPFNETFVFCKLFNKWIDCDKLFYQRSTERGLCYTFNTLNIHEMYTDE